jgi:class 3 adenylate cyclase
MLPVALALDVPLLLGGTQPAAAHVGWLIGWQLAVELTCLAVIVADHFLPWLRAHELPLYVFCGVFMLLTTWAGLRGMLIGRSGLIFYAAGSTFIAAVICTARPVRRPMYALSLLAIAAAACFKVADIAGVITALVAPFCVVVLCMEIDKVTHARHVELFQEMRKVEFERARADKVLYNVLPTSIADELKREDRVNAQKFDNMGVLFADIVGFTSFSRSLPPDALVLVLNQIFSAFDELVERYALEKIKTIGDAYMVVSHRCIDSLGELALEMVQAMERYNRENGTALGMRIGMHAGPAVAGVIGVKRFLYDVWGDTVNLASRMESTGAAGAIHVTDAVYQQTRHRFAFEAREPVEIRGRGVISSYWLRAPLAGTGAAG